METLSAGGARPERRDEMRAFWDALAPERDAWIARNAFYYEDDYRTVRFLVPEGLKVLELGCGTGALLARLKPSLGVGVDLSPRMIEIAKRKHPQLRFVVGDVEDPATLAAIEGPFDAIILSDTIGSLVDCEATLGNLHALCSRETRLVIAYYSHLWEPILTLAERLGVKMPQPAQNWLSARDIEALLHLADFEVIKREWRQLVPKRALGLGRLVNRFVAPLPLIRWLCLRNYVVARPLRGAARDDLSVSVIVPCRNERGNVEPAVRRLPTFGRESEIIFVEGHSSDGTYEEAQRVAAAYPDRRIQVLRQDGIGKADAVRKGFESARGDVILILDGDLTVAPEDLPKFYRAIARGKGEFINGSRFVYPMQDAAMRRLNSWANRAFAAVFSFLLNQRFTDTLCGTKALTRRAYERIARDRAYFGDRDPFGDFDLILGAAKQNLKIVEIPVRYAARTYGESQISRFRDGWLLLRMVVFAYLKLKAL
jgi:SAM-dependent methyltransferase